MNEFDRDADGCPVCFTEEHYRLAGYNDCLEDYEAYHTELLAEVRELWSSRMRSLSDYERIIDNLAKAEGWE